MKFGYIPDIIPQINLRNILPKKYFKCPLATKHFTLIDEFSLKPNRLVLDQDI